MELTDTQLQTLRALIDVVVPPDDFPGALEAGVDDYILQQLQGDLAAAATTYQLGLDALDAEALHLFELPFAGLRPDQQTHLFTQILQEQTQTEWPVPSAGFAQMVVHHTAEGYYADPGNGGNRDARSWDMIGFRVTA